MAMPFAASVGLPLPGSPFPVPAYPYDVLPYAFVLLRTTVAPLARISRPKAAPLMGPRMSSVTFVTPAPTESTTPAASWP